MSRPEDATAELKEKTLPFVRTELFASLVVSGIYFTIFTLVFFSYVL